MTDSGSPILETLGLFGLVAVAQVIAGIIGVLGGLFVLTAPLGTDSWTIITSVYAHANLQHLVSNSIALILFGWPVARATTRLRFHAFFISTGAIAGVSQILISDIFVTEPGVLGASGAVFALFGYLLLSNRLTTGVARFISVPRWITVVGFLIIAGVVTVATATPGAALIAHFTGFFLGLIAGRFGLLHPSVTLEFDRTAIRR